MSDSDLSTDPTLERLRAMFDHCVQLVGLLTSDGRLIEANRASLAFAGVAREDVLGRHLSDTPWWDAAEDAPRLERALADAASGLEVRHELSARRPDGETVVFDASFVPVRGDGGAVRYVVAEARDITKLHAAREALRTSEAHLSAILTGTLDAIISIDEDQRIRLFNQGAETIFGYEADEVVGSALDLLIPDGLTKLHRGHVAGFAASPDVARPMGQRGEITGRRKDGSVFPAEASISKARVDGRFVFTAVLRDVTERYEVERARELLAVEQERARRDAEAATRARDEMLRVVSHDLRNPVTGVVMGVKMLRYQLEEGHPGHEILDGIELAAGRQGRLIRDLTDVASIEAGRLSVEPHPQRPAAVVQMAVKPFEALAAEQGIGLRWDAPRDLPLVDVDRERMVQAVSNLLDNAIKVTPPGGAVRVQARAADGAVHILVSDTGPGVPEGERERIFERFWRGSSAGEQPGSGLGLAIAQGIVQAHGGSIRVDGAAGGGSMFRISLPVAED